MRASQRQRQPLQQPRVRLLRTCHVLSALSSPPNSPTVQYKVAGFKVSALYTGAALIPTYFAPCRALIKLDVVRFLLVNVFGCCVSLPRLSCCKLVLDLNVQLDLDSILFPISLYHLPPQQRAEAEMAGLDHRVGNLTHPQHCIELRDSLTCHFFMRLIKLPI
eukprot:742172-Hanusia_phi.AAC.2